MTSLCGKDTKNMITIKIIFIYYDYE